MDQLKKPTVDKSLQLQQQKGKETEHLFNTTYLIHYSAAGAEARSVAVTCNCYLPEKYCGEDVDTLAYLRRGKGSDLQIASSRS
jgi:hypothetical protein